MRALIGSRALALCAPGIVRRRPRDTDLIMSRESLPAELLSQAHPWKHGPKIVCHGPQPTEIEVADSGSTGAGFLALVASDPNTTVHGGIMIPSLDALFALKTSHRYLKNSPHFWKTLGDWHSMKATGATIKPGWRAWLRERARETYDYKHPRLRNQSKASFFDTSVDYVYDHDSIHRAVAVDPRPAYTYYLRDGSPVDCDRGKWNALPRKTRINGVVEEAAVLAIERSLVPFPGKRSPRNAWMMAFSKVATSITSGWFRRFAYEHALDVLDSYPANYWERFQDALSRGDVPRHSN